ncbi:MAG: PTS sugar transporter subunit IIA [Candidatus Izemoplasmataceae bacterium]
MVKSIRPEHMQIVDTQASYEDAIRLASKPLLEDGYITEQYIDDMLQAIKDYGPYIVLADDFAMPHARPSEAVKKTGLSLLVVKDGVDLMDNHVKLFIVLAAKNSTDHTDVLGSLAEFLMEKTNIQDVIKSDSVEAIQKILNERWKTA